MDAQRGQAAAPRRQWAWSGALTWPPVGVSPQSRKLSGVEGFLSKTPSPLLPSGDPLPGAAGSGGTDKRLQPAPTVLWSQGAGRRTQWPLTAGCRVRTEVWPPAPVPNPAALSAPGAEGDDVSLRELRGLSQKVRQRTPVPPHLPALPPSAGRELMTTASLLSDRPPSLLG